MDKDKIDYTEVVEELLEIKEQISAAANRLEDISGLFGYNSWVYNVMSGYVTPYLRGTIGENRTITMNLQNIIDAVEELQNEEDESDD